MPTTIREDDSRTTTVEEHNLVYTFDDVATHRLVVDPTSEWGQHQYAQRVNNPNYTDVHWETRLVVTTTSPWQRVES